METFGTTYHQYYSGHQAGLLHSLPTTSDLCLVWSRLLAALYATPCGVELRGQG